MTQSSYYEYFTQNVFSSALFAVLDDRETKKLKDIAAFFGYKSYALPDFRAFYLDDLRSYKEELYEINNALVDFYTDPSGKKVLIAPYKTLRFKLPEKELLQQINLEFAAAYELSALKEKLYLFGYSHVDIVETKGEVSFRGDMIDIFPINSEVPYRLSFFDTECESIRVFDVVTQMSQKEEIERIAVNPAFLSLDTALSEQILKQVEMLESDSLVRDIESLGFWCLNEHGAYLQKQFTGFLAADAKAEMEKDAEMQLHGTFQEIGEAKTYKDLVLTDDIESLLTFHKNKKQTIIASNEAILKQYNVGDKKEIARFSSEIINVYSAKELVISLNKPQKPKRQKAVTLAVDELKSGDFVVHEKYGIALFKGMVQRQIAGATRDFVELQYQGEDRLLVPVDALEVLSRYVASGGLAPAVDKLGKGSFARVKEKLKDKLFAIAGEIIEVSAKRELIDGVKLSADIAELTLFKSESGFEYTADQQRVIAEIFDDFESGKVMDRVLSGDVGFGKTEVAMNAVFLAIKNGYQAAFIAPTKILANQHFMTFKERFSKHGISVSKLDNSVKPADKKRILDSLKDGTLDFVVGTHGLLAADFKNIALVIIDEEHKFGVKQKEKIKALKHKVHVLSMSATPIPRTLNQALSSIKGMSSITTPPKERVGVRTYVKEYSDKLIKEAILREKRRAGQLFFIYNNIATIENKKEDIKRLLPDLNIATLHSKVTPAQTEEIMDDFANKKYDLLLSTSIVESGIHLPNVNTMIVQNSDKFGIADLHQLRGRVGRGNKEGFCYLLVEDKDTLTDDAKKRLLALESNSFLGSGYNLAYYDLEIRGGGNILGEAQSGHIKQVGYALYLNMLEDAINKLSGNIGSEEKECEVALNVSAYISDMLVKEDRLRLDLYRRLSKCRSTKEVYKIEEEMCDRFGKLDESSAKFINLMIIKVLAKEAGLDKISNYNQHVTLEKNGDKQRLEARSKDDDDILDCLLVSLRGKK